jgi:hypothetical protein
MLADEAHVALGREALPVKGGDAAGFLTAMLQGVKPERSVKTCFVVTVDSENTAFFTGFVIVMIE